jgi:glycosyltransferase involved in cell wall biosynthesis
MKLGLGLIVKNEEIDLPNCLETFLPEVDAVVIVDTGSSDNTIKVATDKLKNSGIPYQIVTYFEANDAEGRINNFSQARNEYIKILEGMDVDWIWSTDADDTLTTPDIKQMLIDSQGDIFAVNYRLDNGSSFLSYKIWKTALKLRFIGRVHECLNVDWTKKIVHLPVIVQHHYSTPTTQENGSLRNLRILKEEIYPPLRSLFYYANENVDIKNYPEAIKWYYEYIRRAKDGETCWHVELAHCYFRAARWLQHLGETGEAIRLSRELLQRDPSWSESWCELAYIASLEGNTEKVVEYSNRALQNKFTSRLFSEPDKYTTVPTNMILKVRFPNVVIQS